jgi:hypothetical protein
MGIGHAGAPPARRSLRPRNPVAILGVIMVGLTAMLLPELVMLGAIATGHGPSLEELMGGAPEAFPLVSAYVLVRQGVFFFGALAVAALASRGRGAGRAELGFRGAPWLAIIAGVAGLVTKIKLEVVRVVPPEGETPEPPKDEQVPPGGA